VLLRHPRHRALTACAVLVLALFGTAVFAPLPYSVAPPGLTADVLGKNNGTPVISVSGVPVRATEGELRMVTIAATGPSTDVSLGQVIDGWFRTDRAVMPSAAVYPSGGSDAEIARHNLAEMKGSQASATRAAQRYIGGSSAKAHVTLHLADVGGPSAGLLFSLGIVDKLRGDGHGGDLTGGRTIAGTGTISADGKVGAVGGVPLKTQSAARDGATVFLVPKAECAEAGTELPHGLRLVPVTTLKGAVSALLALKNGRSVPSC
jgi:PDZ domain-containing protein